MEVTINYNGQAVAVEVTLEVYEFLDRADHKTENLFHEQRRHWDGREFDEYIITTEGVGAYGETPEEYLCHMETLHDVPALCADPVERALKPTQEPFRCTAVLERSPPSGESCLRWEQHKARREGHKARQNPSCRCPWQQVPVSRADQGSLKSCAEGKAPFRWRAVHRSPLHAAGLSAASTARSKASSPAVHARPKRRVVVHQKNHTAKRDFPIHFSYKRS